MSKTRGKQRAVRKEPIEVQAVSAFPTPTIESPMPPAPIEASPDMKGLIGISTIITGDKIIPVPFMKGDITIAEALSMLKQLEEYILTSKVEMKKDVKPIQG